MALAGHQQRVHKRLWVMPPDADQQAVDEPPDYRLACVDARNHLRTSRLTMAYAYSLFTAALTSSSTRSCMGHWVRVVSLAHLRNDHQPSVYGHVAEALLQGTLHIGRRAVSEPER